MKKPVLSLGKHVWVTFSLVFAICLVMGVVVSLAQPVSAAPQLQDNTPTPTLMPSPTPAPSYKGSEACAGCHKETHDTWAGTLHAHAFSSSIFQKDWTEQAGSTACLECHTTGFDVKTGTYVEEGVACEACHGPLQSGHPKNPMPVTPDYTLCAKCHKTTTDEWRASKHGQIDLNCEACHDPHTQKLRAATVNELCINCHKDTGSSFTHGTHANSGLQCNDCHMATASHTAVTGGLVATGHTFAVGSEACINCHKDTVHTRDTIVKLTGEQAGKVPTTDELQKKVSEQEQSIQNLESQSTVRLYTGLMQGAIVGLIVGGVAAWVVSRRIRIVEVEEDDSTEETN